MRRMYDDQELIKLIKDNSPISKFKSNINSIQIEDLPFTFDESGDATLKLFLLGSKSSDDGSIAIFLDDVYGIVPPISNIIITLNRTEISEGFTYYIIVNGVLFNEDGTVQFIEAPIGDLSTCNIGCAYPFDVYVYND